MALAKPRPRQPKPDQAALVSELIELVKTQTIQQNKVLETALETQKSMADTLATWMKMFQGPAAKSTSTTEEERAKIREAMDAGEWEPLDIGSIDELLPPIPPHILS